MFKFQRILGLQYFLFFIFFVFLLFRTSNESEIMTSTTQPATSTLTGKISSTKETNVSSKTDGNDKQTNISSKRDASWPSVLFYIHLNILGLYGVMVFFTNAYFTTVIFTAFLSFIGIIGVTCGAHRLWTHQTYKASTFLKLFLMLCQTMSGQVNEFIIFSYFHILFARTFLLNKWWNENTLKIEA